MTRRFAFSSSRRSPVFNHAAEICARYNAGATQQDLADDHGVHTGVIREILREGGVEIRPRPRSRTVRVASTSETQVPIPEGQWAETVVCWRCGVRASEGCRHRGMARENDR